MTGGVGGKEVRGFAPPNTSPSVAHISITNADCFCSPEVLPAVEFVVKWRQLNLNVFGNGASQLFCEKRQHCFSQNMP